jgi:hypothetical protein
MRLKDNTQRQIMLTPDVLNAIRPSLFAGQYNLLLGSGVSLDSFDRKGAQLKSAAELTTSLCGLKGVNPTTLLSRVSLLLNTDEIEQHITKPYSSCRAGETVKRLTSFVWRTAFTLNVDDALEAAYESVVHAKQEVESLNFDTNYKTPTSRSCLPIVHLHGFTREPEKTYVFSTSEYSRVTRGMNPWMHVLSEVIASEPFIVAGTSLNEPDLEYYLSGRTESSGRSNRGPSLFIEPFPDKITENLCQRHGLVLVRAKLADFLAWLLKEVGDPPSVTQLTVPSIQGVFKSALSAETQVSFFTCFELVRPVAQNPEGEVSPFHFGKAVRWSDLESSLDVPTNDELAIGAKARNFLNGGSKSVKVICVSAEPGSGMTTDIRRAAYNLAKEGQLVVNLIAKSAIDTKTTIAVLPLINRPVVLVIDGLADHATALRTVIAEIKPPPAATSNSPICGRVKIPQGERQEWTDCYAEGLAFARRLAASLRR